MSARPAKQGWVPDLLDGDVLLPRDEVNRYRIYGRRGAHLDLLATAPNAASLGVALVTIDDDCRGAGRNDGIGSCGAVGVLDGVAGHWIINPWHRPEMRAPYPDDDKPVH